MRVDEVPQQPSILAGRSRACYARDANDRFVVTPSRGWDVEAIANGEAQAAIDEHVAAALAQVRAGAASPLAWHMARFHMDAKLLAATMGIGRWRVRRHLRPAVFAKLAPAMLARYGALFGIDPAELSRLPEPAPRP